MAELRAILQELTPEERLLDGAGAKAEEAELARAPSEQLRVTFTAIDSNQDGLITPEELMTHLLAKVTLPSPPPLRGGLPGAHSGPDPKDSQPRASLLSTPGGGAR